MATSPALLSIDEYLQTSYKPDADFVDGEIEERNVGEHTHNFIQGMLYHLFTLHAETWGTEAIIEQRIRVSSLQVRVCDVAVVGAQEPFEEVLSRPPLVCIEIMSPEDRLARAEVVLADYRAMGVKNIWLVDPMRHVAYVFDAGGLHRVEPSQLEVAGTAIRVDLAALFAKLDEKLGRASLRG